MESFEEFPAHGLAKPSSEENDDSYFAGEVSAKDEEEAAFERRWMQPDDLKTWFAVREQVESKLADSLPGVWIEFDTLGVSRVQLKKKFGREFKDSLKPEAASFNFYDRATMKPFLVMQIDSPLLDAYGMKSAEKVEKAYAKDRKRNGK
jgi:hypothetical protein